MTLWMVFVPLGIAMLKCTGAIAVVVSGADTATMSPYGLYQLGVLVAAFGFSGVTLIAARTEDRRAIWLGAVLLLAATPFADAIACCGDGDSALGTLKRLIGRTPVTPLLPVFFWLFVRDFPSEALTWFTRRAARAGLLVSVVLAFLLISFQVTTLVWPREGRLGTGLQSYLSPDGDLYWPVIIASTVPGFILLMSKVRAARVDDRRRVVMFATGLVLGFGPISVEVLLEALIPPYGVFIASSVFGTWLDRVVFLALVAVPLITAYSVMVDRVVEIRLVVRSALQYALARFTLIALMLIPLIGVGWYLYQNRSRTLVEFVTGPTPLFPLVTLATLGTLLTVRRRALRALDRRFFREQYDARLILSQLADTSRKARTADELVDLVCRELDRALHLDYVTVLLATPDATVLRSPDSRIRPLSRGSGLALLAQGDASAFMVDLVSADSPLRRLPEEERHWLLDSGFGMLVPLNGTDGTLQGLIGLGHKRSDLPFSREDRRLLEDIATSVALNVENRRLRHSGSGSAKPAGPIVSHTDRVSDDRRPAVECDDCGRIYPPGTNVCDCGSSPVGALVPYVLAGKFQMDRRLGRGGMGVVYRALDLDLGRHVAIKTLPHMDPEQAVRLRREAKAMAAVQHENLAIIFGSESWFGTPMLVVELLAGGTLAARLLDGPLPWQVALGHGTSLVRAVEHLHRSGVLHCDIKPSNIGFTRSGVPKLLDFGLATVLRRRPTTGDTTTRSGSGAGGFAALTPLESDDEPLFAGTPRYMSPEALAGDAPREDFDVWGLTVVLFEAITGRPPFEGQSVVAIADAVIRGDRPDIRHARSECPAALSAFFSLALSPRAEDRPRTADHLARQLLSLRQDLQLE